MPAISIPNLKSLASHSLTSTRIERRIYRRKRHGLQLYCHQRGMKWFGTTKALVFGQPSHRFPYLWWQSIIPIIMSSKMSGLPTKFCGLRKQSFCTLHISIWAPKFSLRNIYSSTDSINTRFALLLVVPLPRGRTLHQSSIRWSQYT